MKIDADGSIISDYIGVLYDRFKQKWLAYIIIDNQIIALGYFTREDEAAQRYDAAAMNRLGPDAILNFR